MRAIKFLITFVFMFALMLVIVAGLVLFQALEPEPLVTTGATPTAADASRTKALAKRALGAAFSPAEEVSLTVPTADMRSVLAFAARAVPSAKAHVMVDADGMRGRLTLPLPLPENPFGRYLNFDATLAPSDDGLKVNDVRLGGFHARYGHRVLQGVRLIGDAVIGDEIVSRAMNAVRTVQVQGQQIRVTFTPIDDIGGDVRVAVERLRGVALPASDPETVAVYFARVAELHAADGRAPNVAIARYMTPLARLAAERSAKGDAVAENQAMILGLAMYFTKTAFFEQLIGKVRTGELANIVTANGKALLRGRQDLMLHFMISAALQVLANDGVTYTIGEFKELLDSDRGGSGFSFVDLAADRAGVRFAETLTDPRTAKQAQALLARSDDEGVIVPPIRDLPERMPEAQFRAEYGSVDDERYRALVREIDARIADCALYRG